MRARIRKDPFSQHRWFVEIKRWYWPLWSKSCIGHMGMDAKKDAMSEAKRLLNPEVIEVEK